MSIYRPLLAVLLGSDASLSPAEVARSADGLADLLFLLDSRDRDDRSRNVHGVANALAPTATVDFGDPAACLDVVRDRGAVAVTTFTDRLCGVAARLDATIKGKGGDVPPWGRKDVQRRRLREAGVSQVRSARIDGEPSLRDFVRQAGFPVVVKPVGGAASRDTWMLRDEADVDEFVRASGADGAGAGMLAEEYIRGEPSATPHLADYVSAEVFLDSDAARPAPSRVRGFVTDRLVPAWPCRETGLVLPSTMPAEKQAPLLSFAGKALDSLGAASGVFHIELKLAHPSPEIIECNGRLGGFIARLVRYGTGQDLARLALSCALGRDEDLLSRGEDLDLRWDRCVLVLLFQPPGPARSVLRAPSRREIARQPGVLAVDDISVPGTRVDWRDGTNFPVAWVWLAADNHHELRSRLIEVAQFLTERFVFSDDAGHQVRNHAWLDLIVNGTGGDHVRA